MVRKTKATNSKTISVTPDSRSSGSKRAYKEKISSSKKDPSLKTDRVDFTTSISIQEKVALLAYSYWEKRGGQGGSSDEDWYRAEKEILGQLSISGR